MTVQAPLWKSVDILVVGLSCGGVEAALAASKAGANVLCVSSATYPGEDIADSFRYTFETSPKDTPLCRALAHSSDDTNTPSPMHVKHTLEQALIAAGVEFVYMSYPALLLRDTGGSVAGLVLANRSGFQAIRAKAIIDATHRAIVGRMTGATFAPWKPGPCTFTRIVAGGEPVMSSVVKLDKTITVQDTTYPLWQYTIECDMPDASPASFAAAEVQGRLATWHPRQILASERMFFIPSDRLRSGASPFDSTADIPQSFSTAPFVCGSDPVYLLGPCADCTDNGATELSHPSPLMRLGNLLGTRCAEETGTRPLGASVTVDYLDQAITTGIDVCRKDAFFRLHDAEILELDLTRLPALAAADVLVAGGGTAGAPAAIASGRRGSHTILVEYLAGLGGVGTEGRIASYYHGNRVGFTAEMDLALHAMAPNPEWELGSANWNTEWKKLWYLDEAHKAGVHVWFGALHVATACAKNSVRGIAVATPYAPVGIVTALAVVDATGNADVSAAAGAEVEVISKAHIAVQGTGLSPYIPGRHYANTDHTFVDDCDVFDVTRAFAVARAKFKDCFDLARIVDSRQRRQVKGRVTLDALDFLANRRFPDTVVIARSNFDSHGFTIHPVFLAKAPNEESHDARVPLRALLPQGLDGVIVTGLGVSAHRDALPVIRMQADVQNQGYAAGWAASMAVETEGDFGALDIRALQRHLVEIGMLPVDELNSGDSFPLNERRLNNAWLEGVDSHAGLAVMFAFPDIMLPRLRKAYRESVDGHFKERTALVMGLLGDDTGVETLVEILHNCDWDTGWDYRGMGQFGFSMSRIDSILVAATRTGNRVVLPALMHKLTTLAPDSSFSHFRALTLACEAMPCHDAAPHFAAFLAHPNNHGGARASLYEALEREIPSDWNDTSERNRELRELLIARGLLACGDCEGKGRAVLEAYRNDVHGHYARHARALLEQ